MSAFKLTLNSLFNYLSKQQMLPELQKETEQIYVLLKKGSTELALFFRLLGSGELLQIVTYLPVKCQEHKKCDVARLLHKLNCDLDLPGFCYNETANLIFYRQVLPCLGKMCEPDLLEQALNASQNAATTFIHVIHAIANTATKFDDLLKKSP